MHDVFGLDMKLELLAYHIGAESNARFFSDDIFKYIFLLENLQILIKISLKFVP